MLSSHPQFGQVSGVCVLLMCVRVFDFPNLFSNSLIASSKAGNKMPAFVVEQAHNVVDDVLRIDAHVCFVGAKLQAACPLADFLNLLVCHVDIKVRF